MSPWKDRFHPKKKGMSLVALGEIEYRGRVWDKHFKADGHLLDSLDFFLHNWYDL